MFKKTALVTALAGLALAGTADAAVIIPNSKIANGASITGTMVVINSAAGEIALSSTPPQGPNWIDPSMDGYQLVGGGVDGSFQGNSPWEMDGSTVTGQHRVFGNGNNVLYTFNLASSGIDLPDGSVINAIYGTWTTRGTSGGTYSYVEGTQNDSKTRTHTSAPNADLQINWTDNLATVRTANFEQLLSGPITVEGGDGFELRVARNGNTHQSDAIILDVTIIPEPGSLALLGLGGLMIASRRRA